MAVDAQLLIFLASLHRQAISLETKLRRTDTLSPKLAICSASFPLTVTPTPLISPHRSKMTRLRFSHRSGVACSERKGKVYWLPFKVEALAIAPTTPSAARSGA
jgi:hypothetical protein